MEILIGMDEAGYGPNLGPLVVAATAWEVDGESTGFGVQGPELRSDSATGLGRQTVAVLAKRSAVAGSRTTRLANEVDLYRLLRPAVICGPHDKRIGIADSKVLYRPGLGLRQLERGVHTVLATVDRSAANWSAFVEACGADPHDHHRRLPWHDGFDCLLPVDAAEDELPALGERFRSACAAANVRPLAIRARLIFPAEFNELVDHYGTKGAALSHVTVGLLREVMDTLGGASQLNAPISVVCDKHGGRNFYAALLQHHFAEHWIEPVCEGAQESRYEWGPMGSRVRVSFRVGGEAFLPTALASMTAKYLRELAMRAFNEFWCARVPGLQPTAGYPLDARRFRKAIAAKQRELGVNDHVLWRNR